MTSRIKKVSFGDIVVLSAVYLYTASSRGATPRYNGPRSSLRLRDKDGQSHNIYANIYFEPHEYNYEPAHQH